MIPNPIRTAALVALVLLAASAALAAETPESQAAEPAVASPAPDRPADHVVLVSIDGLRPEFYLDPTWPAPVLHQLVEEGSYAEGVVGVFPSVTYPSHTTMVTGVVPARHGVFYNSPFEPEGQTGAWYWDASEIQVPTLWDAVGASGGTTAAIGWPVTVDADIDFLVPEVWPLDREADFVEFVRARSKPADLLATLEREATGKLHRGNFTIDYLARDIVAAEAAAWILEHEKPNLLLLHLIGTDHFQHADGRDSHRVRRAVAAADTAIGLILEAVERAGLAERTTFVITGDHGHVDLHTRIAPNVWLAGAGLLEATSDPTRGEWRAVFHTTGSSAFLHLRDASDRDAVVRAREAIEGLPPGQRSLFRVVERDELDRLGVDPAVPFALDPEPGIHVTSRANGEALQPADGATHGYVPDFPEILTGFVASGAGIRDGGVAHRLRLVDVAPTVARLLGVEMPSAIDGAPVVGFFAE